MSRHTKKSKYFAKVSLAIMGAGFLATIPLQDSLIGRLLQGGFEAGLVGGLADWFAVTALFRHPLGIPIPHTALLPKNRDRMIGAVISMLENDWLTKESIQEKIKSIRFSEKLLPIAEKEMYSIPFKKWVQSILVQTLNHVDLEKLSALIEKEIKGYISSLDVKKIIQSLVKQTLDKNLDAKALDYILAETEKWISKEETKVKIGVMAKQLLDNTNADGFLKIAIQSFSNMINEEKLGNMLQPFFQKRIVLLQNDDNHFRHLILARIRTELESVHDRKELIDGIDEWKDAFVNNWNATDQILETLKKTQDRLVQFIEGEEFVQHFVLPFLKKLLDNLRDDSEKIEAIENWIQRQIFEFIDKNHSRIGILVKENLDKLDNVTLINMVENNVGKDLQWIRVNGAICGFLIGIVLTLIKAFV